jgi:hypothetical protein
MTVVGGKKRGTRPHRCIDVWALTPELFNVEKQERFKIIADTCQKTEVGPFPPNSLTTPAPITFLEEAVVLTSLGIIIGGPLLWINCMIALLFVGSWSQCGVALAVSFILAFHPMPPNEFSNRHVTCSWWTRCIYKYFTYRFVWSGDSHESIQENRPWIGAGVSTAFICL